MGTELIHYYAIYTKNKKSAKVPVYPRVGKNAASVRHCRHDSHRVSLKRWPQKTPHPVVFAALAHPCALESPK